jgi:RNA recognition motif-containing protein
MTDNNKLFVGSLPWAINNDSLRDLFTEFGEIEEAIIITDRDSGRSKGFGFVRFKNAEDAQKALSMNGKDIEGRTIVVNIAKPREPRDNNRGGGGFRRDNNRRRDY